MWRVIGEGMASLRDVDEWWSLTDILDANEYLDVMGDVRESKKPPAPGPDPSSVLRLLGR